MVQIFRDAFHDGFGTWPLAYIRYGGPDIGEIEAVAQAVGDGDDGAFHAAWVAAGDRLSAEAEAVLARGHRRHSRALLLKAACAYRVSYHPLFGEPVDPRLLAAFRQQITAFDRAMALSDPPVAPLRIPFGETTLPAYLIPAAGAPQAVRPLLILTNGYDASITDPYFASAVAASRRGYHCLIFDGPGQGGPLYEQGLRLRPDWESVVGAVVDTALRLPQVDPARIALSGWSLGGHLALRAATGEHRLAACIADPGLWCVADGFRVHLLRFGASPEAVADLATLPPALLAALDRAVQADRRLRWSVLQRGFWVHGTPSLGEYLAATEHYTLAGRAHGIRCPTLLTMAERDPLSASAPEVLDALRCPKTLLRFTAAEGAGGHCEMTNRSLLNERVLDWLDETLG